MSDRRRQQRAALIVGGAAVGGLAIIGLAIALTSGDGDDSSSIDTRRTSTTSSSTTSSSSTSTSTTTLLTLPPTIPTTTPPTTAFFPTTAPPPAPTTAPPTNPPTNPPTTQPTTTTTAPSPQKQLANDIATALNGGTPPAPGQSRVTSVHIGDPDDPDDLTRVRWKLIDTLTPEEQEVQARLDAWNVLKTVKDTNLEGTNDVIIRGTIPNPSPPPATDVVVTLGLSRQSLDAIDFTTFPPAQIFDLPLCDDDPTPPCLNVLDVDTDVVPPSTSTSSSSSTTSTTDPDEEP
jgi:hypothetical protein